MEEEITLTNKFSYDNEVAISYFANTYKKLSCFGYKMFHSKMKCEKVILNNYEEYYKSTKIGTNQNNSRECVLHIPSVS